MNERHAYKIPQLNKWGVIDSTVLEIELTTDSEGKISRDLYNAILSNPHARYKYSNNYYHFQGITSLGLIIFVQSFASVNLSTITPQFKVITIYKGSYKLTEQVMSFGEGGGSNITIDNSLSDTSTNPVQNKVITNALRNKADVNIGYQFHEDEILISKNDGDCLITGSGKTLSDFVSKQERRQQSIVELTANNISTVKQMVIANPATLIKYNEYIYAPTYNSETIPGYYACCAVDESIFYFLVIDWDNETIDNSGNFSLEEIGVQIDDFTQL